MPNSLDVTDPKVQMAFACEGVSQDPFQRVSFNNLIDSLNAVRFPVQTPQFFVIFGFECQVPKIMADVRLTIERPRTGDPLVQQKLQDIAFTSDRPYARIISGFQGFIWPEEGDYAIRLTSQGKRVLASFTLQLKQIPTPQISGDST